MRVLFLMAALGIQGLEIICQNCRIALKCKNLDLRDLCAGRPKRKDTTPTIEIDTTPTTEAFTQTLQYTSLTSEAKTFPYWLSTGVLWVSNSNTDSDSNSNLNSCLIFIQCITESSPSLYKPCVFNKNPNNNSSGSAYCFESASEATLKEYQDSFYSLFPLTSRPSPTSRSSSSSPSTIYTPLFNSIYTANSMDTRVITTGNLETQSSLITLELTVATSSFIVIESQQSSTTSLMATQFLDGQQSMTSGLIEKTTSSSTEPDFFISPTPSSIEISNTIETQNRIPVIESTSLTESVQTQSSKLPEATRESAMDVSSNYVEIVLYSVIPVAVIIILVALVYCCKKWNHRERNNPKIDVMTDLDSQSSFTTLSTNSLTIPRRPLLGGLVLPLYNRHLPDSYQTPTPDSENVGGINQYSSNRAPMLRDIYNGRFRKSAFESQITAHNPPSTASLIPELQESNVDSSLALRLGPVVGPLRGFTPSQFQKGTGGHVPPHADEIKRMVPGPHLSNPSASRFMPEGKTMWVKSSEQGLERDEGSEMASPLDGNAHTRTPPMVRDRRLASFSKRAVGSKGREDNESIVTNIVQID